MATWTMHKYHDDGGHWTITNGHTSFDVHPSYDGSRQRDKYPDGIIVSCEQSKEYAEQILLALNKSHVAVTPHIPKGNK